MYLDFPFLKFDSETSTVYIKMNDRDSPISSTRAWITDISMEQPKKVMHPFQSCRSAGRYDPITVKITLSVDDMKIEDHRHHTTGDMKLFHTVSDPAPSDVLGFDIHVGVGDTYEVKRFSSYYDRSESWADKAAAEFKELLVKLVEQELKE